jgi:hypothetical protein
MVEMKGKGGGGAGLSKSAAEIKDLLLSHSEVVRERLEGHKDSVNSLDYLSPVSGYFGDNS